MDMYRDTARHPEPYEPADFYDRLTPTFTPEELEQRQLEREKQAALTQEANHRFMQKMANLKPIPGDLRIPGNK